MEPVTRKEKLLSGGSIVPVTREEKLLANIEGGGGGGGGTYNYNQLTNQPQVNGNVLKGNKTSNDLGLASLEALTALEERVGQIKPTVVDAAISGTSTNPVQNRVIKNEIDVQLGNIEILLSMI